MTSATTERNLMGLGVPGPLARLLVEGPMEWNGMQAITGYSATTFTIFSAAAATSTAAGSNLSLGGGAGGSTSGNGGTIFLTGGGATSGTVGFVVTRGKRTARQGTPTAKTVAATLTAGEVLAGIITANQGGGAAANYQLPTATNLEAAFPFTMSNDDSFDFALINISTVAAEDITITTNTGWTLVGNMTVASNAAATDISSGLFRARRTAANTFTLYRIA